MKSCKMLIKDVFLSNKETTSYQEIRKLIRLVFDFFFYIINLIFLLLFFINLLATPFSSG